MLNNFLRKYFYKYRHNKFLRFIYNIFFNLKVFFYFWFWRDYFKFKKENKRFRLSFFDLSPILNEKTKVTNFDSHYIYHTAWAMRKVKQIKDNYNIDKHIDFSSSLHFCTSLSAFISVQFYDYRPAFLTLSNLKSQHADLTNLANFLDDSVKSISCMHVIEHIGLGRYGDSVDPDADIKAIEELKRICAIRGNILFVTPVGKEKIMFNAHRIYSFNTIKNIFGDNFELKEFSLVTDQHKFLENVNLDEAEGLVEKQNYGCGCFWFIKKKYEKYTHNPRTW